MSNLDISDKRVLIVDDQRPFLVMLRGLINTLGGTSVMTVQNGESAVAACKKEKYDIIISDLHLGPDRKNGFQLLEEIRVRKLVKPDTIYIMVSADSERPMVLGSIEKEPDDYLVKPFSQAQLHQRLSKAYAKKQALKSVYSLMLKDDWNGALQACRELLKTNHRYHNFLTVIMADLYWRLGQPDHALHMLSPMLQQKPLPWVMLAMAKTWLQKSEYDKGIDLVKHIIERRLRYPEAHDILAQCYLHKGETEAAKAAISRSLEMAPYSLARHYLAVEIARACADYELAKQSCRALYEQSKKSVFRNINHLCNYIRSILDVAEHAEDRKERNKYQQEALLSLQRCRNDELLSRTQQPFSFEAFEQLIEARVNYLDGKLLESKRATMRAQHDIQTQFDEYPLTLAPDSMKVLFDLGEFEDALALANLLNEHESELDANLAFLISSAQEQSQSRNDSYAELNKKGIEQYAQGQYQAAYESFGQAQEVAPMNTGIALNVLQCLTKLLESEKKPNQALLASVRHNHRLVDGMPLPPSHAQKLATIKPDLEPYLRR